MICCTLITAAATGIMPSVAARRHGRRLAPALGVAALASVLTVHMPHYAARAASNERTLLAEIAAQPLCTGSLISSPEISPKGVSK